jgi:hypothetical protein
LKEAHRRIHHPISKAPKAGKAGSKFLEHLANANNDANPGLPRLALKLATGAGKTTVKVEAKRLTPLKPMGRCSNGSCPA